VLEDNFYNKSQSINFFKDQIIKDDCSLVVENITSSSKALLASIALKKTNKNVLIITSGKRKDDFYENLETFFKNQVVEFFHSDLLPKDLKDIPPNFDIIGKRYQALQEIKQAKNPQIVLASFQSLLENVINPDKIESSITSWSLRDNIIFDDLPNKLSKIGYERQNIVVDKGQFAVRGGILDIFVSNAITPYRIEFFDNKIESIRSFDPNTQKSIEKINKILICPANENIEKDKKATLLDYLEDNYLVIFDDVVAIEDEFIAINKLIKTSPNSFFDSIKNKKKIFFIDDNIENISQIEKKSNSYTYYEEISFEIFAKSFLAKRFFHSFFKIDEYISEKFENFDEASIINNLSHFSKSGYKLLFLYETPNEKNKIEQLISQKKLIRENVSFEKGYFTTGFVISDISLFIISETELFHKIKIRRQKWRGSYHTPPSDFHALTQGDLVVHFHSGIGKFLGIEKQKNYLGQYSEFLVIEYSKNSKLYVPASQSHLVSRYIGSKEDLSPGLSTLGSAKWQTTKAKAQKQIIGYALDLIKLYAKRQIEGGFQCPADSTEMTFFEEEFPYVETEDQNKAILDIKNDMCSNTPMERLICGDVGYGKTEVAMRAAFKTVFDGKKQVAFLVPTTVLAMQHYENLKQRMINYPINIEILSRFNSAKKNKEILKDALIGKVDILVGTHRLLSKDVSFKQLGLIIIDEEQRFGVRAKEHLKNLKSGVDCLFLSATPIPRTLYMSLINIKKMSVINTPPQDRLPIKTIIAELEENLVKDALLKELARAGQAFIVHNRVETIYKRLEFYKSILPNAKISLVHGQMDVHEIDDTFHDFKSGKTDILLATTIVENGIDIPNANTIIIENANNFGIADLYQLRGRVGRWNKTAYAYFLTPKKQKLTKVAKKRLSALLESGSLGGGMKIALRDLEIRGAGDILGTKQSGQISNIGFHLYCKLLKQAISALQEKRKPSFIETKMEFTFNATLPSYYINEPSLRMELYNRIGSATSFKELDDIFNEIKDRFGQIMPNEILWLYHLSRIRLFASGNYFTFIKFEKHTILAKQQLGKKIIEKSIDFPKKDYKPKEQEEMTLLALSHNFKCSSKFKN
jgi:transcription-repair coupling factor (superfamily II helicase)